MLSEVHQELQPQQSEGSVMSQGLVMLWEL